MNAITVNVFERSRKITLNRPDRLNSFNAELKQELLAALAQAAEDPQCRALLITGAGRGFCAGQDLAERAKTEGKPVQSFRQTLEEFYNPLALAIRAMNKPVVCAVNGVAAGAGANLALSCDIVIAARSAKFIQAFSNIGLTPDTGGSWYLPRLVGDARARGLIMLGLPITAEQAEQWGMIWQAVDDNQLEAEAQALVENLAARPTRALASAKVLLDHSYRYSLQEQLEAEAQSQNEMGATADYKEGVDAFLNKRTPEFNGQ
ncbi:MAG: 2-(1,2-epoxy-1,2-dihydrophenyl)acetyl-CoA isomerase [Burkholderiaceae bacterium]|nr:2-(1,2-epoxy-1,2-dihydrophenyl)acetyl-CoA isomerase [Burkholderiaceae bacterium]